MKVARVLQRSQGWRSARSAYRTGVPGPDAAAAPAGRVADRHSSGSREGRSVTGIPAPAALVVGTAPSSASAQWTQVDEVQTTDIFSVWT